VRSDLGIAFAKKGGCHLFGKPNRLLHVIDSTARSVFFFNHAFDFLHPVAMLFIMVVCVTPCLQLLSGRRCTRNPFPTSKDVLPGKKTVSIIHDVAQKYTHLNNTAQDLCKGIAALPQRVQDHGNRRTEAPDDPDDDPCGEPTDAKNGTRKEEREWYQNKHDESLVAIKSSESVSERGEITD
jgi:hypothetical protein